MRRDGNGHWVGSGHGLRAAIMALCFWISGCAVVVQPDGPTLMTAHFGDTHFTTSDGRDLPLRIWPAKGVEKGVIVAFHGFNDYSQAFEKPPLSPPDRKGPPGFGPHLSKAGYTVYAYDQRGFGGSPLAGIWPGTERLKADAATAVELVASRHAGVPVYMAGESMGGAVVITTLAAYPELPVSGALLFAPAVWAPETMPFFYPIALEFAAHLFGSWTATGSGLGRRATDNDWVARGFAEDPLFIKETRFDALHGVVQIMDAALDDVSKLTVPILYLYGLNDQLIPVGPTVKAVNKLPDLGASHRLALYDQGFHLLYRDLDGLQVLEDVQAWLADPKADLPTGADQSAVQRLEAAR